MLDGGYKGVGQIGIRRCGKFICDSLIKTFVLTETPRVLIDPREAQSNPFKAFHETSRGYSLQSFCRAGHRGRETVCSEGCMVVSVSEDVTPFKQKKRVHDQNQKTLFQGSDGGCCVEGSCKDVV